MVRHCICNCCIVSEVLIVNLPFLILLELSILLTITITFIFQGRFQSSDTIVMVVADVLFSPSSRHILTFIHRRIRLFNLIAGDMLYFLVTAHISVVLDPGTSILSLSFIFKDSIGVEEFFASLIITLSEFLFDNLDRAF